jgi:translation initiation factor IF-2
MMMKYRVHEVAKDLNVPNKQVIDVLQKYTGETKKHMTALTEDELDMVFETFTQQHSCAKLDEYFAQAAKRQPVVEPEKPDVVIEPEKPAQKRMPAEKPAAKTAPQVAAGATPKEPHRAAPQNRRPVSYNQRRPATSASPVAQQNKQVRQRSMQQPVAKKRPQQQTVRMGTSATVSRPAGRIIDTHTPNVELDRYNERYDRLASEKVRLNDNTVKKQKLNQRSTRYRGRYHSHRETESERLHRIALERKNKPITVQIPEHITVGELAMRLKATAAEVIKKLMNLGTFAAINDVIDFDTASLVAMEFHAKVQKEVVVTIEDQIIDDSEDDDKDLVPRAPVIVVMGHVDHGKTSLLDAIRHTNVTATEAGGITQRIGAYRVNVGKRDVTFLDTPGHEAFTTMRARGAQVTDIAILVVAADDGIMPQTVEAIHHAQAAKVSIIVAINKMDKPGANPEMVMEQLTKYGIVPEQWGGDTPCVQVSAVKKTGIKELLDTVLLVADLKELKANPDRAAKGTVIEARLDKGRGPMATILVQNGTLHKGDIVVAGTTVGRVRAMMDENGKPIKSAGPSVPVEITGLDDVPLGGDVFDVVTDERLARELVQQRRSEKKEKKFNSRTKVTLDNLFEQMQKGDMKSLQLVVKADVQGSVEAVCQSLEKLSNDEVRVDIIHSGVGAINESDVMLAVASNAIIIGFNVRPDNVAEENAKRDGVDVRLYRVIYDCINEVRSALKGMLAPKLREAALGKAEVRQVYHISSVGTIAGAHVASGKVTRDAKIRVVRDGVVLAEDSVASLKRFKDDAKEVLEGYDCGIGLQKYNDIKEGDVFEAYKIEEYRE